MAVVVGSTFSLVGTGLGGTASPKEGTEVAGDAANDLLGDWEAGYGGDAGGESCRSSAVCRPPPLDENHRTAWDE